MLRTWFLDLGTSRSKPNLKNKTTTCATPTTYEGYKRPAQDIGRKAFADTCLRPRRRCATAARKREGVARSHPCRLPVGPACRAGLMRMDRLSAAPRCRHGVNQSIPAERTDWCIKQPKAGIPTAFLLPSYCGPTGVLLASYCGPTGVLLASYCGPTLKDPRKPGRKRDVATAKKKSRTKAPRYAPLARRWAAARGARGRGVSRTRS